jgi:hypothetical protein
VIVDPIVTIEHVRAVHLCVRGTRAWFVVNGLDFRHFLTYGLPASAFEATGDALGISVAAYAREQAAKD